MSRFFLFMHARPSWPFLRRSIRIVSVVHCDHQSERRLAWNGMESCTSQLDSEREARTEKIKTRGLRTLFSLPRVTPACRRTLHRVTF